MQEANHSIDKTNIKIMELMTTNKIMLKMITTINQSLEETKYKQKEEIENTAKLFEQNQQSLLKVIKTTENISEEITELFLHEG